MSTPSPVFVVRRNVRRLAPIVRPVRVCAQAGRRRDSTATSGEGARVTDGSARPSRSIHWGCCVGGGEILSLIYIIGCAAQHNVGLPPPDADSVSSRSRAMVDF